MDDQNRIGLPSLVGWNLLWYRVRRNENNLTAEGFILMIFPDEKRSEPRAEAGEYLSVEFRASKTSCLYQFKLRNVSSKGICLLLREDSDLLKKLEVGDVLDMKYYPKDLYQPPVILKTQIKHISLEDQGRFKGHYLVGLLTLRAVRLPTDDPRMG